MIPEIKPLSEKEIKIFIDGYQECPRSAVMMISRSDKERLIATIRLLQRQNKELQDGKAGIEEQIKIQSSDGNWNYDSYMHGMANGLICALATINGEEANYLSAPKQWLKDKACQTLKEI